MDFVVVSVFKLLGVQVLCIKVFEMGIIYIYMSWALLYFALLCFALLLMDFIAWVKGVVLPSSNTHTSLLVSSNESNIKTLLSITVSPSVKSLMQVS